MSEKWMRRLFKMLHKLYRKQNKTDGRCHFYVWASNDDTGEFMVYTDTIGHAKTIKRLLTNATLNGEFE